MRLTPEGLPDFFDCQANSLAINTIYQPLVQDGTTLTYDMHTQVDWNNALDVSFVSYILQMRGNADIDVLALERDLGTHFRTLGAD